MTSHRDVLPLFVPGAILPPVTVEEASARVWAYCTHPSSGWSIYDLAAITARQEGHFEQVRTWDLLLVALMNARPSVSAVAEFTVKCREDFAARVSAVPASKPLAQFSDDELEALTHLCAFGFAGARTPTITKLAALYRPHAVTILDSYLASVFDVGQYGFSYGMTPRAEAKRRRNIRAALTHLRSTLRDRPDWMAALRRDVSAIPGIAETSDVRLLDIVLWTTHDDGRDEYAREARKGEQRAPWVSRERGELIPIESGRSVPIGQHRAP